MQTPIEIVYFITVLGIAIPMMIYIFDKSKLIFDFSLIFSGAFWCLIWLNTFYIDLGTQIVSTNSTNITGSVITTDSTEERLYSLCQNDPCENIQQSWNLEKFFIVLVGLVWILVGALSFRKGTL